MSKMLLLSATAALWLTMAAGSAQAAGMRVSPDIQRHLGVATQRLTAVQRSAEVDAFAKVLDPAPLAQMDSDLATAEAAAAASRPQADRSKALNAADRSVAAKDVEAAVSQARQDALKVQLLRRQLGLTWGPGIARMSDAARGRLVRALADGSAALVHVDTHNNEGQAGARFVNVDVGDDSVRGVVIGPARAAEPRLQSSGLIVEVTGPSAMLLSVGLTQSAHIESKSPQAGVVIPRAAVIRYRGLDWVYVRTAPDAFERRLVEAPAPGPDGFFVSQGLSAGDEVVVQGAEALFAAEQNASVKTP
jgi:hypothetical protein